MKIGSTDINNVYIGSTAINTVYIGSTQVFPNTSLLLDTYSGATGAYSLRKLRTAYSGSAIRVRRSSDNTEQDIGFLNNQLDTTSLTIFCIGTDGFIVTWYDQSGNGNNLVQATAANQPQIVSSGSVLLQNSKPTLRFDGSNDWLDVSITKPARFSIFSVMKLDSNTTRYFVFGSANSMAQSATTWGALEAQASSKFSTQWGDGTNYSQYTSTSTVTTATQDLISLLYDSGTNIYMYRDNSSVALTAVSSAATTSAGTSYKFAVGRWGEYNGVYFDGDMQELIVYSSYEGTNRSGINGNMNTYWSIY